jgi:hypothetical protein
MRGAYGGVHARVAPPQPHARVAAKLPAAPGTRTTGPYDEEGRRHRAGAPLTQSSAVQLQPLVEPQPSQM